MAPNQSLRYFPDSLIVDAVLVRYRLEALARIAALANMSRLLFCQFGAAIDIRQSIFHGPSSEKDAMPHLNPVHTEILADRSKRALFSVVHDKNSPTLVSRLFGAGGPTAVTWLVGAIVVDAVHRVVATWPRPHVGSERREIIAPAITHGNPSAAVPRIGDLLGVQASVLYRRPDLVLQRSGLSVRSHRSILPPYAVDLLEKEGTKCQ